MGGFLMAVTLQNLIDDASDLTDHVNDPGVSVTTWTRWANLGIERLYRLASQVYAGHFQTGTATTTLVGGAGLNLIPRPANMRQLAHVVRNATDPSTRRAIRKYVEGNKEAQGDLAYRIEGTNVVIEPFQYSAGTYTLYYVVGPTVLVNVGDTMDADLALGADYVETYMAIRCLDKEESDSSNFREDLADLAAELPMTFASLDTEPDTIVDVDMTGRGPWPVWLR
jgi:hypothetical protein